MEDELEEGRYFMLEIFAEFLGEVVKNELTPRRKLEGLKCAVSIGHYTHTECIIQCEVFIVQPTVCSAHLFPCK